MNCTVNIEDVIKLAKQKGRVVKECNDPEYAALDCGPAPENERMRITSTGALLMADEGRYWQTCGLQHMYDYIKSM